VVVKVLTGRTRDATAARRRIPLLVFIGAGLLSLTGNTVTLVAIPWFVLTTTGSATKTGITALFATLPYGASAFFGAVVVNRVGARRMSVFGDAASAVAIAAIPLLHGIGALQLWQIWALTLLRAVCDAPAAAARHSLVPDLARTGGVSLERANSLYTSTEHVGYVIGAPIAGLLVALLGTANVLWISAAAFLLAAAAVRLFVPARQTPTIALTYLRDVLGLLRFVRHDRVILALLILPVVGSVLISPLSPVVLPTYTKEVYDSARSLGLLLGAYGVGGISGTALVGIVGGRTQRKPMYAFAWLTMPLTILTLSFRPPLPVSMAALFVLGSMVGIIVPLEQTVRQERTPPELRARLFGALLAAGVATGPLGMVATGLMLERFGVQWSLVALAVAYTAWGVGAVRSPAARQLERLETTLDVLLPQHDYADKRASVVRRPLHDVFGVTHTLLLSSNHSETSRIRRRRLKRCEQIGLVAAAETFSLLIDEPDRELVLGGVVPCGVVRGNSHSLSTAEEFLTCDGPGCIKVALSLRVCEHRRGTLVLVETRAKAADPESRAWLRRQQRAFRVWNRISSRTTLRRVKRAAEQSPTNAPGGGIDDAS
jgi:MFS family permease